MSFAYTAREWVLRDVSFTVRQGQTVAALNVVLAAGRIGTAALAVDILPRLRDAAGEIRQLL